MNPLLLRALPYAGAALLALSLLAGAYFKGRNAGREAADNYWQVRWDEAQAEASVALAEAQAAYEAERRERERLAALVRDLPPPPPPRTLIREVPVNGPPVTTCPRLSPEFRMHWNQDEAAAAPGEAASLVVPE